MDDFNVADKNVNDVYKDIGKIAKKLVDEKSKVIDDLIKTLSNVESLSDEEIRKYMLKISLESYSFSEIKEHSVMKQDCAAALMKETQANIFNSETGTAEVRRNKSITDSNAQITVNILYNSIANLMKTKLDEAHRVVNTLNSILISRAAAAKLNQSSNVFDD